MAKLDTIVFRFTGGISDDHQLNFYEAGRFQYGAARLIFTLEKFRQEGNVVAKLSSRVKADIRIAAAKKGSYLQEIIMFAVPVLAECAVSVPFNVIFTYIWDKILPESKGHDAALKIAEIELARDKEKTLQSQEETKRHEFLAQVALAGHTTAQQALEIIAGKANQADNGEHDITLPYTPKQLKTWRSELEEEATRSKVIFENQAKLASISTETERKLVSQVRKSLPDISMPLRSSAESLHIGIRNKPAIASLDIDKANRLAELIEDEVPEQIVAKIKSYDKENGLGKIRVEGMERPISFRVPGASINSQKDKILDSMKLNLVEMMVYFSRDRSGTIVSALFLKFVE